MGAGDALDLVAGPADDYPDVWFDFVVGEAGEQSGDMICKVSSGPRVKKRTSINCCSTDCSQVRGKNAARGNVHRFAPVLLISLSALLTTSPSSTAPTS